MFPPSPYFKEVFLPALVKLLKEEEITKEEGQHL